MYLEKPPFPQPSWPPTQVRQATKLVIISKYGRTKGFSKEKVMSMEHDYVYKSDSITAYKKEIELAELLSPVETPDSKPPKEPKVLMDGAPGVGKTTLAIKACREWAEGRLFQKYDLVILVSLRQINGDHTDLSKLFPCYSDPEVIDYCLKTSGERIALIFDGYDELPYEQREQKSIFLDIIHGDMLPKCALVVTSRPYASGYLQELHSINRHVEVVGFKKPQIYTCIRSSFSNADSEVANKLISQLEEREDILSLCYIPLNCMIMLHVYKEIKTLFTTMTGLFKHFVFETVKREIKKTSGRPPKSLDSLPKPISLQLSSLAKVAYKSLVKDQFIFSEEELLSAFDALDGSEVDDIVYKCLGLITRVCGSKESYYQFLHLSIQEFLAARYAATSDSIHNQQLDILQRFVGNPRFRLFLLFYVGLDLKPIDQDVAKFMFYKGLNSKSHQTYVYQQDQSVTNVSNLLYFAHMIFESQNYETYVHLFNMLEDKSVLSMKQLHKLTQFDCTVLAHFLCSIEHAWQKLDLSDCSLSLSSLKVFHRVWKERNSGKKATFKSIDFSRNDPNMIGDLHTFPWIDDVQILTFIDGTWQCDVNEPLDLSHLPYICRLNISANFKQSRLDYLKGTISSASECQTNAKKVVLRHVKVGTSFDRYLDNIETISLTKVDCGIIQELNPMLQTLKELILREVYSVDEWLSQSASQIARNSVLRKLELWNVEVSEDIMIKFFRLLEDNISITELVVSGISLECQSESKDYGKALATMLSRNRNITSLKMCNHVDDQNARHLIGGLERNSTLHELDVGGNFMWAISTIQSLISVAMAHEQLKQFFVETSTFTKDTKSGWTLQNSANVPVTERLFCSIAQFQQLNSSYSSIDSLSITCDSLDSFICVNLFQTLEQNKHVKTLKLNETFCILARDRAVSLALINMLAYNNTLKNFNLHFSSSSDIQMQSDDMYECLATGLSKSSLREVSLQVYSCSNIASIIRALTSSRVSILKFGSTMEYSMANSDDIGSVFEQFLANNSSLVELDMGYEINMDDATSTGIANGLLRNKTLKSISISFSPKISKGVADFFRSITTSGLTRIDIIGKCFLDRTEDDPLDWSMTIDEECNSYSLWSQLEDALVPSTDASHMNIAQVNTSMHSVGISWFSSPDDFRAIYKQLKVLSLCTNLKVLTISNYTVHDFENWNEADSIGQSMKYLLTQSLLKVLTLNCCNMPLGTWEDAAQALASNNTLETLELSNCELSASEGTSIFHFLKENCCLINLNVSGNTNLKNSTPINNSIEAMFKCNRSLQKINLTNSIDDGIAKKVVSGLHKNKSSKINELILDAQFLTISTLQSLLSLTESRNMLTIEVSEVRICRTGNDTKEYWSGLVNHLLNDSFNTFEHKSTLYSKSNSKLICSLCKLCFMDKILLNNITNLNFKDAEEDVVIIVFRLTLSALPRLCDLSFTGNTHGYQLSGITIGRELELMLKDNKCLHNLTLKKIDEIVFLKLASGLLMNNSVKWVEIEVNKDILNTHNIQKLFERPAGLLEIGISGLPQIYRHTQWSKWVMDGHSLFSQNYMTVIHDDLLSQFIVCLWRICNGQKSLNFSEDILTSLQHFTLTVESQTDQSIKPLVDFLSSNLCTIKRLSVFGNSKLRKGHRKYDLYKDVENMLSHNDEIDELCLSGSFTDDVSTGIVAGLQANQSINDVTVKDTSDLKFLNSMIKSLIRKSNPVRLTVSGMFVINKYDNSQWQVKVLNQVIWPVFLNLVERFSPSLELLTPLKSFTRLKCIENLPVFNLPCECVGFATDDNEHNGCNLPIERIFTELKSLSTLSLVRCGISDDACDDIAAGLEFSTHLNKLELTSNSISGRGATAIFQALCSNQSICELDISCNQLVGHSSLAPVIEAVLKSTSSSLEILRCSACCFDDEICRSISLGLRSNSSLKTLNLSRNSISADGMTALTSSLQHNCCLQQLNLSANPLFGTTDDGAQIIQLQAMKEMLRLNKSLSTLELDCAIDRTALDMITEGLQSNTTLKTLTLSYNEIFLKVYWELTKVTELKCLNLSDTCSLIAPSADASSWTIEVKKSEVFCHLALSDFQHQLSMIIILSQYYTMSSLDLKTYSISGSQLINIFQSLGDNNKICEFTVCLDDRVENTESALGQAIYKMLKFNCTLKDFEIHGHVHNEVIKALDKGLKANHSITKFLIDVRFLKPSVAINFTETMEDTGILEFKLYPIFGMSRKQRHSPLSISRTYYQSPCYLIKFLCHIKQSVNMCSVFDTLQTLDLSKHCITNATLFGSESLQNYVHLKQLTLGKIGDQAHLALERLMENNHLQSLNITSSNDYLIQAIAKGLRNNQSLYSILVNVDSLTDGSLTQLLQSLSGYPLALIDVGDGCVQFVRCISPNMKEVIKQGEQACSILYRIYDHSHFVKVLQCLKVNCVLQELIIVSQNYRGVGNALKDVLMTCKTIQILRIDCPLSVSEIEGLCAGLKENQTLQCLEVHNKSWDMKEFSPVIASLKYTKLTKLHIIAGRCTFLFTRMSDSEVNRWNVTIESIIWTFFDDMYQLLCQIDLEINTINSKYSVDKLELTLTTTRIKLILSIFKSMTNGTLSVRKLVLKCEQVAKLDRELIEKTAIAINLLLISKDNESLKELVVESLDNDTIENHLVAGIYQATFLTHLAIRDTLGEVEHNSLIRKVLTKENRQDLTDGSICELHLHNIWVHCEKVKDDHQIRYAKKPQPTWKIQCSDEFSRYKIFSVLSRMLTPETTHCSNKCLGWLILHSINKLDLSHTEFDVTDLFNVLRHDTAVIELDISYSKHTGSTEVYQAFESMLQMNTSLQVLSLTGMMDNSYATILIKELPNCSLKSLTIDLNIEMYDFEKVKGILCSYVKSRLCSLVFMDVCYLQKQNDSSVSVDYSPSCDAMKSVERKLLMFKNMLNVIDNQVPSFNLTLGQNIDSYSLTPLQSLTGLHLSLSYQTLDFATCLVQSLPHGHYPKLTELSLSHDKAMPLECTKLLASSYEQLLSTSQTLKVLSLGYINDEISSGITAGLKHNTVLQTLQFYMSALTDTAITAILDVIIESDLVTVQITDCCTIQRGEESSFSINNIVCGSALLCRMIIALTNASPKCSSLLASLTPNQKLSLCDMYDIDLATRVFACLAMEGKNSVVDIDLSKNEKLVNGDAHTVGLSLKQLLLSNKSTLKKLCLSECEFPDALIVQLSKALVGNTSLKHLNLGHNKVTNDSLTGLLSSLTKNSSLEELDLSDIELVDAENVTESKVQKFNEIGNMLKCNKGLSTLHFRGSNIEPLCKHIAAGMEYNTKLRVISMEIKDEDIIVKLCASLQKNMSLKELDISESSIKSARGGHAIQELLTHNSTLEVLYIESSGITNEVCEVIARGLSENKCLTKLSLSYNNICKSGVVSIFTVLDRNVCNLQVLHIEDTCGGRHSAEDVAELQSCVLATNCTLQTLKVGRCCYFEQPFGIALLSGLKENTSLMLRCLDIHSNYFDSQASSLLKEVVLRSKYLRELNISNCQLFLSNLDFISRSSLKKIVIHKNNLMALGSDTKLQIEIVELAVI